MHYAARDYLYEISLSVMKYLKTATLSLVMMLAVFAVPMSSATAATTYYPYTNASLQAQINALMLQVQLLQQQLALRGVSVPIPSSSCYDAYYCSGSTHDIDAIEVRFSGSMAQVRVEYDDNDVVHYAMRANTEYEVATILSRELRVSINDILRLIEEVDDRRSSSDIRSIDVVFDRNDAEVTVRFRDGDRDRFTLRNVREDEDDVIEEIADRYNERERDIEDLIDFEYEDRRNQSDIRSIEVRFFSDDADIVVRFRNNNTDRFTLRNVDEDEDEVIEYLADRYNERERDIEDVIDFRY